MSREHNLQLVRGMYEALNAQDLEAHHEFWCDDMVWHGPPGLGVLHGIEAFKNQLLKPFYAAFPDYHAKNDIEVADEHWVAATGFVTGTHLGPYLGFPASGRPMRMRFSDFWSVRDGKLFENFVMIDNIDVLSQLGVDLLAQGRPPERAA